jgi:hypothetical protein
MHEIVTLQFGQQSNYLGTHFWNTQVSTLHMLRSKEAGDLHISKLKQEAQCCPVMLACNSRGGPAFSTSRATLSQLYSRAPWMNKPRDHASSRSMVEFTV